MLSLAQVNMTTEKGKALELAIGSIIYTDQILGVNLYFAMPLPKHRSREALPPILTWSTH